MFGAPDVQPVGSFAKLPRGVQAHGPIRLQKLIIILRVRDNITARRNI